MKFFVRFFLAVVVVLGLIIAIYHIVREAPAASDKLERGLQATFVDKNKNAAPVSTPAPQATPTNYGAIAQQAAFKAGVKLTKFQAFNGYQMIEVEWQGGNAAKGGEFLDELMNSGHLIDIDQDATKNTVTHDARGATVHRQTFKINMR